jgi:hypothetical protein
VCVGEIEGLNKTQNFVSGSTNGEVVDTVLTKDSISVDNVCGAEGNAVFTTVVRNLAAVIRHDWMINVWDKWDFHWADTTLLKRGLCPAFMDEGRVSGDSNDLAIVFSELLSLFIELGNFCWADEGEVEWPEEKYDVFA